MRRNAHLLPSCFLLVVAGALGTFCAQRLSSQQQPKKGTQPAAKAERPAKATAESLRLNNLGVAYMNQQRFVQALQLFEQAYKLEPKLPVARLNQGIALLNQQQYDAAQVALKDAAAKLPTNPRVWYNLGLLSKNLGQAEQAVEAFEHAARLVPNDPDTHYFIGLLQAQLQKYDEAIAALERALALNPFHASAEFNMARVLQRKGDSVAARKHLARFERLVQKRLGVPMSLSYGDQGQLSLAELIASSLPAVPPAIPVRFVSVAEEAGLRTESAREGALPSGMGSCVLDYNDDGWPDVFLVNGQSEGSGTLFRNLGNGRFEDVTRAAKLALPGAGLGCAAGDYDNDSRTDLVVAFRDGIRLFRNLDKATFQDVTEAAGIRRNKEPLSGTFVDFDHDGDLDLYVVAGASTSASETEGGGPPATNVLWRNNGNATFTDWSTPTGLDARGAKAGIVATDFNNDRAIDCVVTRDSTALIYLNPREGRFNTLQAWDPQKEKLPEPAGVVAFDFNKDGWMDLAFTHDGPPGLTLWRNVQGKRLERVPLPEFNWKKGRGLAALDYDNDGWIDLAAAGVTADRGRIHLLRNMGPEGFREVTSLVGLDALKLSQPQALVSADFDGDGDAEILVSQLAASAILLRNDGGNKNYWLRLSFKPLADNKSAIGTKVEVYAGALYQKWEVQGASGYLGQSATDILVGLGGAREAEIVRLLWPTGVPQDEVEVAARAGHTVTEIDRRGSSCPILFAWNGMRYEFIADLIGPGIVGHWVAPGERNVPDPTEYLPVEGGRLRPRHGRLSFRLVEPMEEVVYLDQTRLLAVDHPADVDVYPNERFASAPPFPEFKVITSRNARPPQGAWDHQGRDISAELNQRDRRYVAGFGLLPYKGFAELHWIELNLGDWNPAAPLRLLLHGFTDYFTATSVYAAHQTGVRPIPPYVEALDASGQWVRVVDDMGFPAGLARTMAADLTGRVPPGSRRIRVVTNLKIYWDQILIDSTPDQEEPRITEIPLAEAKLDFLGYPREKPGSQPSDFTYVYEEVSSTGPYVRQAGSYTRYGEVTSLLRYSDDRFAVLGSGDEIALEFDPAGLPELEVGWKRDYFFFADGFSKDMDFYAAHADTVEPLPFHRMASYPYLESSGYPSQRSYLDYRLEFNTRQLSGRLPASLRFQFAPKNPR